MLTNLPGDPSGALNLSICEQLYLLTQDLTGPSWMWKIDPQGPDPEE
jgi:hypothetical protein